MQACLHANPPTCYPRVCASAACQALSSQQKNNTTRYDVEALGNRVCERRRAQQQLDQAAAHAGLDDLLDLVVGAVGEVGQRPARVGQHLLVVGVDQLGQRRQGQLGLCAAA